MQSSSFKSKMLKFQSFQMSILSASAQRRAFSIVLKRGPLLRSPETKLMQEISTEFLTIQQIRAASSGNTDEDGNVTDLDYIHMGDYRLAEADPNVSFFKHIKTVGLKIF